MGIQGGPTMPMPPPAPPMDSPLNGIDFNIMQINVVPQTISPVTTIPSTLTTNTVYTPGMASITRTIRFTADSAMVMDGPFYFNDSTFNMMRIDYEIPINSIEIWKLVNETMVAHPFHIHDVQFYLFDRSGSTPPAEELGRKDVVLVPPFDSVMFITKFEDFADTLIPFMYHCHILMHEDDGMMGQFIVKPNVTGINVASLNNSIVKIYPNPAKEIVNIKIDGADNSQPFQLKVYDVMGKIVYTSSLMQRQSSLNTSHWAKGLYLIEIVQNQNSIHQKIIIE